ncbi:Protein of unknown function [Gryllus bimaculatus]|nr:Protein of unknown function [Gryllus bimaculatus]
MFQRQLSLSAVEFSVCGLFRIDLPFVYAVVGLFATYLIMLIQNTRPGLLGDSVEGSKSTDVTVITPIGAE